MSRLAVSRSRSSRLVWARLRFPGPVGRQTLLVAFCAWVGATAGQIGSTALVMGVLAMAGGLVMRSHRGLRLLVVLAVGLGLLAGWRAADLERRTLTDVVGSVYVTEVGQVLSDPTPSRYGWQTAFELMGSELQGVAVVVRTADRPIVLAGQIAVLEGRVRSRPGRVRGRPMAGAVDNPKRFEEVGDISAFHGAANWLRSEALGQVRGDGDAGRALLAGFLVGDTTGLDRLDLDALRRAGLSHFVAVSGSNVGMFLGLWWLILAPVAIHPRLRAISGLLGIALFVLVTRAEPSVVRAGVMAAVVLAGRLWGISIDAWTALGLAVCASVLVSGDLATNVGFLLSVVATLGVMAGSEAFRFRPRPVAVVLSASLAAQCAVAPVLLIFFGTVPAFAPVTNLVAAPLVASATAIGGVGAVGHSQVLVGLGSWIATRVLVVARTAASWPQLDWKGVVLGLCFGWAMFRTPSLRPAGLVGAVVMLGIGMGGVAVDRPAIVFLDVGQGDAVLVLSDDLTILVDAGPDPERLRSALAEYNVEAIDLAVMTHVHADHLEGMRAVVGTIPVGVIWAAFDGDQTPSSLWLFEASAASGIPIVEPQVGSTIATEELTLTVQGPRRRYQNPNDQSVVVLLDVGVTSVLLTGDVESIAQAELPPTDVDILKVPHHGGATSDLDWLRATSPSLAVIQVGANDFGHPSPEVVEALTSVGATVIRNDLAGDVIVERGGYRTR